MHELSIAVKLVTLAAAEARAAGAERVARVRLRIGRLAGVHAEPLRFAFAAARTGTPLAEAELVIDEVPVRVWCPSCAAEGELPGVQPLACPTCGAATGDIRAGHELELESLEVADGPAGCGGRTTPEAAIP